MTEPLYEAVGEAGHDDKDITEGDATLANLDEFMDFMHSYDVTADPSNDRYLLQDDQHQYEVRILRVNPEENHAFVSAENSRFAKEGLESADVLYEEDFEEDPRDGAIFDDGSNALAYAAERSPDRLE